MNIGKSELNTKFELKRLYLKLKTINSNVKFTLILKTNLIISKNNQTCQNQFYMSKINFKSFKVEPNIHQIV